MNIRLFGKRRAIKEYKAFERNLSLYGDLIAKRMSRRRFLGVSSTAAAGLFIGGLAIGGVAGYFAGSSAAPKEVVEKPTYTGIPSKPDTLIVRAWGGGWQAALKEGVADPFTKLTGIKVEFDNTEDNELQAKLLQLIPKGKQPPVDVNWTTSTNAMREALMGLPTNLTYEEVPNMVEMFDAAIPEKVEGYTGIPFVNVYSYTYSMGYLKEAFSEPPTSWKELWKSDYVGQVGMYDDGIGFTPVLAKLAGLKIPDDLAPEKMGPAWDLLKELVPNIKGHLGEDPDLTQWLITKEVKLECTIVTNVIEANRHVPNVGGWTVPDEGVDMETDAMYVPKNLPPEREYWAKQFLNFALSAEAQTKWSELLGCPPLNKYAHVADYMENDPAFPTKEEHFKKMIIVPLSVRVKYEKDWFEKFEEIVSG